MRRLTRYMLAAVLAATVLAGLPASAGGICYRLQVYMRKELILDRWVGVNCKYETPQKIVSERVGELVVRTIRY